MQAIVPGGLQWTIGTQVKLALSLGKILAVYRGVLLQIKMRKTESWKNENSLLHSLFHNASFILRHSRVVYSLVKSLAL